jgi:hypothetical protein
MALSEEDLCTYWKKQWPHLKKLSVATRRSDGLTGIRSLYPLEEAMASLEEALCTQWKKRLPHWKKFSVATRRSDSLTGRSSLYRLNEAIASPEEALYRLEEAMNSQEEALCTQLKKRRPHWKKLSVPNGRSDCLTGRNFL